jgi:hypothetical protein
VPKPYRKEKCTWSCANLPKTKGFVNIFRILQYGQNNRIRHAARLGIPTATFRAGHGLQMNLRKYWRSLPGPVILASYPPDLPLMRSDWACVLGTLVGDTAFVQAALARRLPEIQASHSFIAEMDEP